MARVKDASGYHIDWFFRKSNLLCFDNKRADGIDAYGANVA